MELRSLGLGFFRLAELRRAGRSSGWWRPPLSENWRARAYSAARDSNFGSAIKIGSLE